MQMKPQPIVFVRKPKPSRESALIAEGYERRTTVSEPRLSELVAEYRRIGFDVEVIEHRIDEDDCGICYEAGAQAGEMYGDVYVRTRRSPES